MACCFPFVLKTPWLALLTTALAGLSDVLDGYFARRRGSSSPTGAALDPLTDKIFAASVMLSLLMQSRLTIAWALLLSLRELLELPLLIWLLYMPRVRALRASHLKANWLGKLATGLQFGALVSLLLELPYLAAWMVATAVVGVLAAALYWAQFVQVLALSAKRSDVDATRMGASP